MAKSKAKSLKSDPLYQQHPGLEFDNLDNSEVIELTDEQQAAGFVSRYLEHIKEADFYKEQLEPYFKGSVKDWAWELRDFKLFYIKLVVSGKWDETKFTAVLDTILSEGRSPTDLILDIRGKMYDQGRLSSNSSSGSSRRRGRI